MQNLKYFCLFFALFAFTAQCSDKSDPVWVNKSFSIVPNIFITSEILPVPPLTIVVNLQSGPAPSTNLFSLGHKVGQNEFNDISILNTTALSSIREFFDIGSLYPLETVAIVSLPGSIFYTAVVKEKKSGLNQIYGFPMGASEYFPEEIVMTNATDKDTKFKVHQLLAVGLDVVTIYVESTKDNNTMHVAMVGVQSKKVNRVITVASGNLSNIFCDWENSTNSVLCIYKDTDTIYRALIALNNQDAEPTILNLAMDSDSSYIPQMVVATKGYFAYFVSRQKGSATDLLGLAYDGSSNLDTDILTVKPLRSFKTKDYFPLQGAVAHGDGVVAFYRDMDAKGNQGWYYAVLNKDMTLNDEEVKLADTPGANSGFKIAKEMGVGAINIMAYTYTSWHGAVVLNLFYGQVLSQS